MKEPLYDYEAESEEPVPIKLDRQAEKISVRYKPGPSMSLISRDISKSLDRRLKMNRVRSSHWHPPAFASDLDNSEMCRSDGKSWRFCPD